MQSGLVFNLQRYSLQDGPGIRTTVFLKGCPLRCWWCHNPEGLAAAPEIVVMSERCIKCGKCREACPVTAAGGDCTGCGACADACPTAARQRVGRPMTVADVLAEVLKDRIFYDESGGGVTFSGGEPLAQPEFLLELLQACRAREIPTAVDTCGFAARDDLLAAARWTDLFLYDLKILDDARHRQYTGISNVTILENLAALGRVHRNIWVRVPVVPGFNDAADDLAATVCLAASVPGVKQVNLLPYHKTGAHKLPRVGRAAAAVAVPPSSDFMEELAERLRTFGLPVVAGG